MKLLIGIYLLLGGFTASFLRDPKPHTPQEWLILVGVTLAAFVGASVPTWLKKRREGVLKWDAYLLPGLALGIYLIGFSLMWYFDTHPWGPNHEQ